MLKVYIQDRCPYCDGQAYLSAGQATDWKGETFTHYEPCQMCEGTGKRGKWICLPDFLKMLSASTSTLRIAAECTLAVATCGFGQIKFV